MKMVPRPAAAPASPPSQSQLMQATSKILADLATSTASSSAILAHFSTHHNVTLDHSPMHSRHPQYPPFVGLTAVRSYFDLISMHYTRVGITMHSTQVYPSMSRVIFTASIIWRWNASGKTWTEDVQCTLDYDEHLKIKNFLVKTQSAEETCVLRAVDCGSEPPPRT